MTTAPAANQRAASGLCVNYDRNIVKAQSVKRTDCNQWVSQDLLQISYNDISWCRGRDL